MAAVTLAAWQAVTSSAARQAEWRDAILPAETALQTLVRDLTCALVPFSAGSNVMVLISEPIPGTTQTLAALTFYTAEPDMAGGWPRAYSVARVRYGVAPSTRPTAGLVLVREHGPVCPAGDPEYQECVQGVRGFEVFLQGADDWTNGWAAAADLPRLARIRLVVQAGGQDHLLEAVAPIPAGLRLEPPSDHGSQGRERLDRSGRQQ